MGNSIEETAVIEANEEAGVTVVISERVGIWHTDLAYPVSHLFHATIIGGTAHTPEGDEILAVDWFTREQIEEMESQNKLRAPWVIEATKLLAGKVID